MQKLILLIITCSILISCQTSFKEEVLFDENLSLWKSYQLSNYSFNYEGNGFVPNNPVEIVVKKSKVFSVYSHTDSTFIADSLLSRYPSIEGLFSRLKRDLSSDDEVSVVYHEIYGFPKYVYVNGGMEGDGFEVKEFEVQDKN